MLDVSIGNHKSVLHHSVAGSITFQTVREYVRHYENLSLWCGREDILYSMGSNTVSVSKIVYWYDVRKRMFSGSCSPEATTKSYCVK